MDGSKVTTHVLVVGRVSIIDGFQSFSKKALEIVLDTIDVVWYKKQVACYVILKSELDNLLSLAMPGGISTGTLLRTPPQALKGRTVEKIVASDHDSGFRSRKLERNSWTIRYTYNLLLIV